MFAGAIADKPVLIDVAPQRRKVPAAREQLLAAGTYIEIMLVIVAEFVASETSGPAPRVIENRDVRFDAVARQTW